MGSKKQNVRDHYSVQGKGIWGVCLGFQALLGEPESMWMLTPIGTYPKAGDPSKGNPLGCHKPPAPSKSLRMVTVATELKDASSLKEKL